MADKKVTVNIGAKTTGFKKGMGEVKRSLKNLAGGIAAVFGAREIARFTKESVQQFAKFEKGMKEVSTLANFSSKQLRNMGNETLSMSRKFGQGFDKLTKARYDIVSAGFADVAAQTKILDVANKAAIGGVTDVSTATDLLTSTLNAYQMGAEGAADASDIWFTTVQLGKTTIPELSASIGNLLPIAKTAGVSLNEVGAALATATAAGIKTPRAVTALGSAFAALTAPTKQAAKALEEAGIKTVDASGKMLALNDVIAQFQGKNLEELRKLIPEKEAAAVIAALSDNFAKFDGNLSKFAKNAGVSEEAFKKMSDSTQLKLDQMSASVNVLKVRFGEFITTTTLGIDPVKAFTTVLGDWSRLLTVDAQGVSNLREEFAMLFDDFAKQRGAQERKLQEKLLKDEQKFRDSLETMNNEQLKRAVSAAQQANIDISTDDKKTQERIAQARVEIGQESIVGLKGLADQMGKDWRGAMDTFTPWWERTFGDMREVSESEVPEALKPFGKVFGGVLGGMKGSFNTWFSGIKGRRFTIFGTLLAKLVTTVTGGYTGGLVTPAGIVGFQEGGRVGATDTVPAMLTPGEMVINREATERFGPLLRAINRKEIQGFQGGGEVVTGFTGKGRRRKATTRPVDPLALVGISEPRHMTIIQDMMADMWAAAWQEQFGGGFGDLLVGGKETGGVSIADMVMPAEQLEEMAARMEEAAGMFDGFWEDMKAINGDALESMLTTGSQEMTNYFTALMTGTEAGGKAVGKIFAAMLGDLASTYGTFVIGKGITVIAESGWPPNPVALAAGIGMITAGSALKAIGPALMARFHEGGIVGASQTGAPADVPITAQTGEAVLSRSLTAQLQQALDEGGALGGGGSIDVPVTLILNERELGRGVGQIDLKRRGKT